MSVLYIVNVEVDSEVAEDWRTWMSEVHIPEMLETGHFHDAMLTIDAEQHSTREVAFTCIYNAKSQTSLDDYTRDHAPRLRQDHMQRYEGRVSASRQILSVQRVFTP